jgi:ASC-1-like (ASCH) protein
MHFNVQSKYFLQIKQGLKTAEGRINKPKFAKLEIGDIITFSPNDGSEIIKAEVTYVKKFKSFKEMLEDDIKNLLPDIEDVEAGVSIYESFGSYKQDQAEFGTISIGFKLI